MQAVNKRGLFPLGLIIFAIGLAAYKAAMLSQEMTGSLEVMGRLMLLDTSFLALLGLIAAMHAACSRVWLRRLVKTGLFLLLVFYTIHSFVLLALDENMSLFDLGRYLREWRLIPGFVDLPTLIALAAFLASVFLDVSIRRRPVRIIMVLMLVVSAAGVATVIRAPFPLQKYAVLQTGAITERLTGSGAASRYTQEERSFYSAALPGPAEFLADDPDIILLIVESLSSINSLRTSGERDLLTDFDRISEQGTLFRNFFANHSASEGGIISLLSGFPPLHYPGATPLMFDEFARQPSIINEYRQRGYFTEFLTNTDLGFIGMDRYIGGLGFDMARGRDEVPAMESAPRFVQNAPSDRVLYEHALSRVSELNTSGRPWLLTVATVSTHLPYTHPEGGEDTAKAVWDWSLQRLEEFYAGLESQDFFEDGILLVVGDHRQMRPLSRQEIDRYGDSAKARIPLLAIGRGIPTDRIDERFFQQSDLLRLLSRIESPDVELSPIPLWVERYNRIYGKVDSINRFSVFEPADEGRNELAVRMGGTRLDWIGPRPTYFRGVEAAVHAQRSDHQFNRSGDIAGCTPDFEPIIDSAGMQNGLLMTRVPGNGINSLNEQLADGTFTAVTGPVGTDTESAGADEAVLWYRAYIDIERPGLYWFRAAADNRACMGLNRQLVLDQFKAGAGTQGSIELDAGLHEIDLRYLLTATGGSPTLQWVVPGQLRWRWFDVPAENFRLPSRAGQQEDP